MTSIGYATLQLIPSLEGVSKSVEKQIGALDGKKFGKAFGKDIAAGVKSSEADVKRAMDAYGKLYDKQKDALGKVAAEQAKLNDLQNKGISGGRLVSQSERLEKAKRDEARALREARDAYGEYERAAKDAADVGNKGGGLADKFKGLAGSAKAGGTEAATGFVAGFGGPIAAIGTKAGPIGLALAAAVALGSVAGGLIAKQLFAGMEHEQQRADVAAKLGLTPEQMKPIADASAQAYASNFGESVAANMDTARAAIQSGLLDPNATKADVQAMVQQLSTVSDVMGEDIPATARAAQQAIRTGLAGNATEAFDLFTKAQQSGLNVSEDFLDTINEYGTQFRKLGLSGPEAIGLINQAVKGGARDTDVAADAIKEFSIRAVDGSKTSADAFAAIGLNAEDMTAKFAQGGPTAKAAFDQVVDIIRGIDDPVKKASVSVGLFGTQSEDLGGALNALDLTSAVNQLGGVAGAAQRASDTVGGTAASSWESMKRSVEVAVDGMQDRIANVLGPTFQEFADAVTSNQPQIVGFFDTLGDVAITATVNFSHGVGGILQALGDMVGGIGNVKGVLDDLMGDFATLRGDDAAATAFHASAQEAYGWGESLRAAGDKLANLNLDGLRNGLHNVGDAAQDSGTKVGGLGSALGALPTNKTVTVDANTDPANAKMQSWWDRWKSIIAAPPTPTPAPPIIPSLTDPNRPNFGRASGGPISGAGGPKSDLIPIWASNGEHMLTASDVQAMGGQAGVYAFRNMLHRSGGGDIPLRVPWGVDPRGGKDQPAAGRFNPWWDQDWMPPENPQRLDPNSSPGDSGWWWKRGPTKVPGQSGNWSFPPIGKHRKMKPGERVPDDWLRPGEKFIPWGFSGGGAIGPDVKAAGDLVGTAYSQANRTDCSGMVARVIDRTLGMPETGLMSTKTAKEWLAARGFVPGVGGPGTISVGWYDHGPNPNDGHMSMTLSDGSNAEAGGGVGDIFQIGGGAAGASDPQYDQHMYLPTVFGEGAAGSSTASSPFAGGSAVAAATGGGSSAAPSSSGASSSGGGAGSTFNFPSSFKELAGLGLAGMGITTKVSADTPDRTFAFGDVAAEAIGGQVDSALGVLGVNGAPGWLKGISTLISGISIGGGSGSADPLSATSTGMGTAPPDDPGNMHGSRAGQQPGPQVVINARDTEDAFVKYQRYQDERSAAKLSRF